MKYALFVLGLLLIAVGAYFVYSGSNIIEIERGWSSVIAGTTALSAGIVTLGLAGIVKALDEVKGLLSSGQVNATSAAPWLSAANPAEATLAPLMPGAAEAVAPLPAEPSSEAAETPAPAPVFSPIGKEHSRAPNPASPAAPSPSPALTELRRRVAADFDFSFSGFHPPPTAPSHEPAEEAEAISPPPLDFGQDPDTPSRDEPTVEHGPPASAPFETDRAPGLPSARDEPQPPPDPAFASAKPKAIGRYEADGTVYVMFADGSIEAQSTEGTRHFKSMADLKASFQSQG